MPAESDEAARQLAGLCRALEARHREMVGRLGRVFRERLGVEGPSWEDVAGLTPAGNVTERHVAQAAFLALERLGGSGVGQGAAERCAKLCGGAPPSTDPVALQGFIRARLLKAGGPGYVEESPEAFLSFEEIRRMFLGFGAVPTYSTALINPVTPWEQDISRLLDRLEARGFLALEVIPARSTRERLAVLVAEARRRWWPVFTGTEHNTVKGGPLLDNFAFDPEFEDWFADSAAVLLGHQAEKAAGRQGFVADDGGPEINDARQRFRAFCDAGQRLLKT